MTEINLDLGCGLRKEEGSIGVDLRGSPDVVADIRRLPFGANSVDVVYLNDVVEHVSDLIALMEEIWRVCKPNARVHIRVVNWDSQYMAIDPTHCRPIHPETFSFFGGRPGRDYYTHARFEVLSLVKGYDHRLSRWTLGSRKWLDFLAHYLHNVLIDLNFTLRAIKEPTHV